MTDPLGENSRNPAKKQLREERVKTQSNTIIINITWYYYIRDRKSIIHFNQQKTNWTSIIENEKSSTLTKARLEETGYKLITVPNLNKIIIMGFQNFVVTNNKQNLVIFHNK